MYMYHTMQAYLLEEPQVFQNLSNCPKQGGHKHWRQAAVT